MSKYQNAKVYKIVSPHTDKVYVGSTCATLKDRLAGHISKFKNDNDTTSKHVLIFGDYEIVLIENVSCENVKELETRERFYIESMNCVNKNIPGRSKKEYHKQYYQHNAAARKEYQKQYIEENRASKIIYDNTKNTCMCGGKFTNCHRAAHRKTKKHLKYLASIN